MSMKRNLSTAASKKHWDFVKRTAERVSQWPSWKQVQYLTVIGEPKAKEQESKPEAKDEFTRKLPRRAPGLICGHGTSGGHSLRRGAVEFLKNPIFWTIVTAGGIIGILAVGFLPSFWLALFVLVYYLAAIGLRMYQIFRN